MNAPQDIVQVAVPVPLYQSFDYLPPPGIPLASLRPGMRLRVPFGRGTQVGLILGTSSHSTLPRARLKRALALLDTEPLLPAGMLGLLQWAAAYYHHPLGEVLFTALPGPLRAGKPARQALTKRYRLTDAGRRVDPRELARAPRQAALLRRLLAFPEGAQAQDLDPLGGHWRRTAAALAAKGWLEAVAIPAPPPALAGSGPAEVSDYHPPALHGPQQEAVQTICTALGRFTAFLLEGVTGSGKTEVYLHAIETAVARDLQALVLVPEIGLTPQLVRRFQRHLRLPLAVFHSGLSAGERLAAWLAARDGRVPVIIGTRSAVFTPLRRPGLIIIDEEHDPSYKQQEGFRYHARDIAVMRARRSGIPVVLGSATPSLESLHNAAGGRYRHLHLTQRAGGAEPPRLKLLDVRHQPLDQGLSRPLLQAMQAHLDRDHQVLLFLNRRGYAPTLYCCACGWIATCSRCDAHLVVHRARQCLHCHHCDSRHPLPDRCPGCGAGELVALGQGTERVEEALARHFPGLEILRIDRDSTRRKGSLQALLARLEGGRRQILLGTQMIAKGHHLPRITLVGILDADQGLFGADFRATERLAQLILQVAGRAGRAARTGEVLIQTRFPEHPLFECLLRHDYAAFSRQLLEERRQCQLPPFAVMALLRAEAVNQEAPLAFLQEAARRAGEPPDVQVLGPAPSPMARLAGRHRAQLLFLARRRAPLHRLLDRLVPALGRSPAARRVRWSLDVDPQELF